MTASNLLAYFRNPEQAKSASAKLRALRVAVISIDRFNAYPGVGYEQSALNSTTGYVDGGMRAGGISDGGQPVGDEHARNCDVVLSAVVDESVREQAIRVIEDAGGLI